MSANNDQSNSTDAFIWKKKFDQEGLNELDIETKKEVLEKKRQQTLIELEKVKFQRKEREKELAIKQSERDAEIRQKENETYEQYLTREKEFEYIQAKQRSRIRIKNGRQQPIDLLASFIHQDILFEEDNNNKISETTKTSHDEVDLSNKIKMIEPIKLVNELDLENLENLQQDVKLYIKFDTDSNLSFWRNLLMVIDQLVEDKSNEQQASRQKYKGRHAVEYSNTKSTKEDIDKIFAGKTIDQLDILKNQLNKKAASLKNSNMDTSYWESVLKRLQVRIAALSTTSHYKDTVKERLIQKHNKNIHLTKSDTNADLNENAANLDDKNIGSNTNNNGEGLETFNVQEVTNTSTIRETYKSECYSPILLTKSKLKSNIEVIDEDSYYEELSSQQEYVLNGPKIANDKTSLELYVQESQRKMDEDEEEFNQESFSQNDDTLRVATHYKLIKPKYYNRINTGFEWNKYNQTHYDVDNPPPKIIQGYKFNIFYPNLLDVTKTPSYTCNKCPDNPDYNILIFSGGPPYEDIAFKIVNGEWDVGDRSNFLCQFDNGIFQLWFQFRRYRYRR